MCSIQNLLGYIDSQQVKQLQDIEAHLCANILACDADALQIYWADCPQLKQTWESLALMWVERSVKWRVPQVSSDQEPLGYAHRKDVFCLRTVLAHAKANAIRRLFSINQKSFAPTCLSLHFRLRTRR